MTFGVEAHQTAFEGLFATYGYPAGSVPNQTEFGFNTDGTVFTQGDFETPGSVANFRGEIDPLFFNDRAYTYNFAPVNYLQLPLERVSVFARASFEFSEAAELYAQGLYADYTADTQLAPTATFFGVLMPPTNPFIPPDLQLLLDSRADPSADVVLDKRMSELGPRISSVQYDVYQATLGLRGQVFDGWSYDAYLQIGANDQTDTQSGNALTSRIEELTFAPDGGEAICGGFNPFGLGSISAECAAYIAVDGDQPRRRRPDDPRGLAQRAAPSIAGRRAARGLRCLLQEGRILLQRGSRGERVPAGRPSRHHWLQRVG